MQAAVPAPLKTASTAISALLVLGCRRRNPDSEPPIAGDAAPPPVSPRAPTTPQAADGPALYGAMCAGCHGLCTEVSDGNTHSHDHMPFIVAGRAGGALSTGRLLDYGYERHGKLLVSIARAMGHQIDRFGDADGGGLPGVL